MPTDWTDLYKYFDAHDLWFQGVCNLLRVISHLVNENTVHLRDQSPFPPLTDYDPDYYAEIDDWVFKWLTHEQNRRKLRSWDRKSDILSIMTPEDEEEDIGDIGPKALEVLSYELRYWHHRYLSLWPEIDALEAAKAANGSPDAPSTIHIHKGSLSAENSLLLSAEGKPDRSSSLPMPQSPLPIKAGDISPLIRKTMPNNLGGAGTVGNGNGKKGVKKPDMQPGSGSNMSSAGKNTRKHNAPAAQRHMENTNPGSSRLPRGASRDAKGQKTVPSAPPKSTMPATAELQPHDPPNGNSGMTSAMTTSSALSRSTERIDAVHDPVMQHISNTHHTGIAEAPVELQECKNSEKWATKDITIPTKPCDCQRCVEISRSVFVTDIKYASMTAKSKDQARDFFSRWGRIEEIKMIKREFNGGASLSVFLVIRKL
ncbi:hypothetical protein B0T17DRAFT_397101 [Bombardia bombarda]|uniref:Uncharacterized protein n=1 Tax=Bombardia bombarda TaxID=252184 RepID=A0AA39U7Z8_9PEZI|nr:hypothetical protein B0T17DRAFT_397101 [Bombardia bombarda]